MPKNNVLSEVAREAKRAHILKLMRRHKSRAEVARIVGVSRQALQALLGKS